jgi:hypothetical protein
MSDLAHFLGREQQAKADFVAAMANFRPIPPSPEEGPPAFDALTDAALHFGVSDLRTRQADRLNALGIDEEQAVALRESARAESDRGLVVLAGVRPLTDALMAEKVDESGLSAWRENSPQFRADFRNIIKDLELDPEVVADVAKRMDKVIDALDEGGRPRLGQHIADLIDELDSIRRPEPESIRPAERENMIAAAVPVALIIGKLVMIAAIMGVTAGFIYDAVTRRAAWWEFFLIALVACIAALAVALGC